MCIEVTYPISEGMSTAIMFLFVQFSCLILTALYSYTVKQMGDLLSNIFLVGVLLLSMMFAFLIPPVLRRQDAESTVQLKVESPN